MKHVDETGNFYGRLQVLWRDGAIGKRALWSCLCDCGILTSVTGERLRNGATKSCGCLSRDVAMAKGRKSRVHGESHPPTAEHRAWSGMRGRCNDPHHISYKYYGVRGITVCARWGSYQNFLADMGRKPSPQHTLDRINNNGNYTPKNCRWATRSQQQKNKRRS